MSDFKIIIPANGSYPVQAAGQKVHCFSATANFKIQFSWLDGSVSGLSNMGATMQYGTRGTKFKGFNLYNNTGVSITVVMIVLGDDLDVIDNRVSIEAFDVNQHADSNPWIVQPKLMSWVEGNNTISIAAVEVALMTSAPTRENRIVIRNTGSLLLYVGPTGLTTATGIELPAQERIVLENVNEIYYGLRTGGPQNVTAHVFEAPL